jgi:hypothetical protein
VREGLGLLPGTFCPHLDSEPWRPAVLLGQGAPAWGAGENVMVEFENEVAVAAWSDRPATDPRPLACQHRPAGAAALSDWLPHRMG